MLQGEDIRKRQAVYRSLIESITLYFSPTESGRRVLDRGRLALKAPTDMTPAGAISKVGRGKWTPIELFAEGVGAIAPRVRSLILCA